MTHAEIARTLLASTTGLPHDAAYVAANRGGAETAWHDVFAITDDSYLVSIGNTGGSEVDARTFKRAIRECAVGGPALKPKARLLAAYRAFRSAAGAAERATAIIGLVDRTAHTFTYVSAGQAPAFVRYSDGMVSALPVDGLPTGPTGGDRAPALVDLDLRDASMVVLCSSEPVGSSTDPGEGMQRMHTVVADERLLHCSGPAAWIARRMLGDWSSSDVAVLVLSLPPTRPADAPGERPRWTVAWAFDSIGADSNGARRAFLAALTSKRAAAPSLDVALAELIFGELLGNVVRHAPGSLEIILDWTAGLPVLHVLDRGPGFRSRRKRERLPADDWSESGRGLFIINACAVDFRVNNREGGGTHARATLPTVA